MKRQHIIRRFILLILTLAITAAPVMARSKSGSKKSSTHSASSHKSSSGKSGSHKASSRKSGSHRVSSGRSGGRHHRYGRSYSRRAEAVQALTDLGAAASLDPNDQATATSEPVMVDTMAQARDAMARNDPAEALGRYLRVLARMPGDLEALSGAGGAALAVGDADAAINFYSRAEKLAPRDGMVKAGLGSALVQKEQPRAALKLFDDAVDLGVSPVAVALDRGLAYDLRGDNRRAQQEYLALLRTRDDPEATRRLALSVAMSGDRQAALTLLDPLLRKQDISAWRTRAFVLAITGDATGAEQAAYAVLPRQQADELKPFLERLPQLKASEKAAAVHFGHFPENKVPQLVDGSPAASAKSTAVAISSPPVAPAYSTERLALQPSTPTTVAPNVVTAPIADSSYKLPPRPVVTAPILPSSDRAAVPVMPAPPVVVDNSAAIAAAQAKADARKREAEDNKRAAEDRKQADRKAAAEKAAADKAEKAAAGKKAKDREEAKAKSGEPERYWVQIASGAYKPDLDKELAKQKAKFGKQLAGKTAWTTPYKATNRLLIGPFASASAAQDYVNTARKDGFSTLPVTTPAGQKVERLK